MFLHCEWWKSRFFGCTNYTFVGSALSSGLHLTSAQRCHRLSGVHFVWSKSSAPLPHRSIHCWLKLYRRGFTSSISFQSLHSTFISNKNFNCDSRWVLTGIVSQRVIGTDPTKLISVASSSSYFEKNTTLLSQNFLVVFQVGVLRKRFDRHYRYRFDLNRASQVFILKITWRMLFWSSPTSFHSFQSRFWKGELSVAFS